MESTNRSKECRMQLDQYGSEFLLFPGNDQTIDASTERDCEEEPVHEAIPQQIVLPNEDIITITEDLTLTKSECGFPKIIHQTNHLLITENTA